MNPADVLISPVVTEKSTTLAEDGRYVFQVQMGATKADIARAVEWAFNVKVTNVNTFRLKGKVKQYGRRPSRLPDWKKAIVTLQAGQTIQLFEGA